MSRSLIDKELLGKLINYLPDNYTTDLEDDYATVVFAEISPRIIKFIKNEEIYVIQTNITDSSIYIELVKKIIKYQK